MSVDISRFLGDGIGGKEGQIKSIQVVTVRPDTSMPKNFSAELINTEVNVTYCMVFPLTPHTYNVSRQPTSDFKINGQMLFWGSTYSQNTVSFLVVEFFPSAVKQIINGSWSGQGTQGIFAEHEFVMPVNPDKCIIVTSQYIRFRDGISFPSDNPYHAWVPYISEFSSTKFSGGAWRNQNYSYTSPGLSATVNWKIIELK